MTLLVLVIRGRCTVNRRLVGHARRVLGEGSGRGGRLAPPPWLSRLLGGSGGGAPRFSALRLSWLLRIYTPGGAQVQSDTLQQGRTEKKKKKTVATRHTGRHGARKQPPKKNTQTTGAPCSKATFYDNPRGRRWAAQHAYSRARRATQRALQQNPHQRVHRTTCKRARYIHHPLGWGLD